MVLAAAMLSTAMPCAQTAALPASAPARIDEGTRAANATLEFYNWYLALLTADRDPLTDNTDEMAERVSASLIAEIRRQSASPDGLSADYFIQAQDFADEWVGHVRVSHVQRQGASAQVLVLLGEGTRPRQLKITLNREKGVWKIRRVTR